MDEARLTLRPAAPEDAEAVVALVNTSYGRTSQPAGWTSEAHLIEGPRIEEARARELVDPPESVLLVAEQRAELVGCVHLQREDAGTVELGLLSVRVGLQGQGIGSELLARAEAYARDELAAERVVIHVVSERSELIAWYERRGYEPTGEREPFEPFGGQRFLKGPLTFVELDKEL